MRKIDKLTLKAFFSPFLLTTTIVVFIFLIRFIMLYFDEIVGKGLDLETYGLLFGYFALMTVPLSLPLAILLSALMCFGNLGEHTELTAIKSAGIPLFRTLAPTITVAALVTIGAFFYNNHITPWANLKGFSLLWDIKTTKLTLNIKEGVFYNEIPGYRIKVNEKFEDKEALKGIIIYDHTKNDGNSNVTLADSGRMYTMHDDEFLVFELFNGYNFSEYRGDNMYNNDTRFLKNKFSQNKFIFSLSSFSMQRTDENQFKYHEYMKNIDQLVNQIDSTTVLLAKSRDTQAMVTKRSYNYMFREVEPVPKIDSVTKDTTGFYDVKPGPWVDEKFEYLNSGYRKEESMESSKSSVQSLLSQVKSGNISISAKQKELFRAEVEKWHKYTMSYACFVMFVIGASLGTIIKKGGFGIPLLVGVSFFILMYVLMQLGDKYAKEGIWYVFPAVWMPDFVLSLIAAYFLYTATNDSKLFDVDFYRTTFNQIKAKIVR
ncbi:MAG: lipopolysaccharide export system permease protein [Spirosomataceae bacterium]|jgi:lipopolysaccharide export system permease protein